MKVVAIIPARYGSTRLPGKPLLDRTGKPLIQHVVEAVRRSRRVQDVYVATDDRRIAKAVEGFGGRAVLTRPDHATGTDRLAEAAENLSLTDEDIVVNVQGDEPEIQAEYIDRLVDLLADSGAPMATLAAPLEEAAAQAPDNVKVVLAADGSAMYFSRARIPYDRDRAAARYLLHLGIYAYRKKFLVEFASLPPTPAERAEKLEQLRALENGRRIVVGVVEAATPGIDTMEDYAAFVERLKGK
ncbi:MAG: 3-deoxy-manno-octulosonate cytidylyltransferase [Phycisphaerae bacterium SM23_33]|nr:MAG: 3-deoxy-manno-octulosonate cytidylyltransferase [Phycisphaerae bacterium SM23_33]